MRRPAGFVVELRCVFQALCVVVLALTLTISWGALPARAACGLNCESIATPPASTIALNGTDRLASYTLSVTVVNVGALGWNLTITSTPFATSGSPTRTLAANASTITDVTEACTTGNICATNPTSQVTYPIAMPAGSPAPAAVKLYNATALTGVGTFTLTTTVTVAVPANTYAGTYSSTLTLAYMSGP